MQMQRLFEIIYILMERNTVTAGELAERFEVSPRTIYRDIDALSAAGVPVYATKGKGGGISLMEHFVLNKSLLSEDEQRDILSSLQSMLAVSPQRSGETLDKLSALFQRETEDWIEADFSDWGGNDAFDLLKEAILDKRVVCFDYANAAGESSNREVEPLQLRFKHRAWYLYGFCRTKEDLRLFKLSRIRDLSVSGAAFTRPAKIKEPTFYDPFAVNAPLMTLKMKIDASQAFRVYDEFAAWQIEKLADGNFLTTLSYIEDEWMYGFILSFGSHAEVTEPEHMRRAVRERLEAALKKYL